MTDSALASLAVIATLLSAIALYGGSPHCRWRAAWSRRAGMWPGLLLASLSLGLWIAWLGVGAGLCAMLALWMPVLMLLPALSACVDPDEHERG